SLDQSTAVGLVGIVLWSLFFFSSRRRHTRSKRDWSSDVCSSDLIAACRGITAQKLGKIVHRIYDHVEVAVIVKVSESTAARCDERRYARSGIVGNVIETAVA